MACLVSETQLKQAMRELGVERFYATIGKTGAMSLYVAPGCKFDPEQLMEEVERKVAAMPEEFDEMLYPLAIVDFEDEEDSQTLEWLDGQVIFPAFEYRQQLNTWLTETKGSDTQEQRPPRIAFYSYKGGVGRSTSLAIVARLLAREGLKVATIDLDLEAPGLNSLLLATQRTSRFGVVDFLYHYPVLKDSIDLSQYIVKEEVPRRNEQPGQLWVMTAGGTRTEHEEDALRLLLNVSNQQEVEISLDPLYLEKFSYIDFDLYAKQNNHVFEKLLQAVHCYTECDVILIDARTGISNVSGAILNQFSDYLSIHIQDNKQNREGIKLIAEHIRDKQKLRNAFWCHTKVPKSFDESERQLVKFIRDVVHGSEVQNVERINPDQINVHTLPFNGFLEDVTAQDLKKYIDRGHYVLRDYSILVQEIMERADLRKMLPFRISDAEREAIRDDFKHLLDSEDQEVPYISSRFLDTSLKVFVGFPGSGKTTLEEYMKEKGRSEGIRVIDLKDFQEQAGKTRFISSSTIFLDWTYEEATQAVCKWLLRSNAYTKWLQENPYFSRRVGESEWKLMRTEPEYEMKQEVAEEIVGFVFGHTWSSGYMWVDWFSFRYQLEYRPMHVLPADLMCAVKLCLGYLVDRESVKHSSTCTLLGSLEHAKFRHVLQPIGDRKEIWLKEFEPQVLLLVKEIAHSVRDVKPRGLIYIEEILREILSLRYSIQDEASLDHLIDRALTLGILRRVSTTGELNDKRGFKLSSVYELIQ